MKTSSSASAPVVLLLPVLLLGVVAAVLPAAEALIPYSRFGGSGSGGLLWDSTLFPGDDSFRILEQSPLAVPKVAETLALARADWKETPHAHLITLAVPGVKREDIKIEVENRVLRITGERKSEEKVQAEKWHRAERTSGKFGRQFRLPLAADMDRVEAHLENGVLRITMAKLPEEKKRRPKLINIVEEGSMGGEDIKTSKAAM